MSAQVDQAGIDYHVILAQNALQQCLDMPELQAELICALIKQTSKSSPLPKLGVQVSTSKLLKKSVSVLFIFGFYQFIWRGSFITVKNRETLEKDLNNFRFVCLCIKFRP